MKLISIRFLGKNQLITEGTAIDLANQLAAKDIHPDFSVPSNGRNIPLAFFYILSFAVLAASVYIEIFPK